MATTPMHEPNIVEKMPDYNSALQTEAAEFKGGMGAVAWAVLEMFKRARLPEGEIMQLRTKMDEYFVKPSNDECNAILKVLETRLQKDKGAGNLWYP